MEVERPAHQSKSGQDKYIWTAVKNNAALVAAIIGLFGVVITGAISTYIANKDQETQQKLEAFNAKKQRELEREQTQDAALQTYLDQMGQVLIDEHLRASEAGSDRRTLTRARTLTTLGALDTGRKTQVLRFLAEANLVQGTGEQGPVISLANADLRGADLSGADLSGADLSEANLDSVNLHRADLREADLDSADLRGADLSQAILGGANLKASNLGNADLSQANLSAADLRLADLSNADLSGAILRVADLKEAGLNGANLEGAYLDGADLSSARYVTNEQLERQAKSLEGATMPNGQKYED